LERLGIDPDHAFAFCTRANSSLSWFLSALPSTTERLSSMSVASADLLAEALVPPGACWSWSQPSRSISRHSGQIRGSRPVPGLGIRFADLVVFRQIPSGDPDRRMLDGDRPLVTLRPLRRRFQSAGHGESALTDLVKSGRGRRASTGSPLCGPRRGVRASDPGRRCRCRQSAEPRLESIHESSRWTIARGGSPSWSGAGWGAAPTDGPRTVERTAPDSGCRPSSCLVRPNHPAVFCRDRCCETPPSGQLHMFGARVRR
jgi:hypothetical protein